MSTSALLLSRFQFAWVIGWHILLPAFTVGMASFIAFVEIRWLATRRQAYRNISEFWIKIFAVAFGMGVVTGIVMPFQFGTNWSRYADATSNVLAPLFAYEGLMAFFLEAAFLGVLLFGRRLVPAWAYTLSAIMVAVGTLFSSFWILAANSWMQTPRGYKLIDGRFFPTNWLEIIFNPSFPYRLAHTVVAFYVTTGFVVLGVGAYHLRRRTAGEEGRVMFSMALALLTVLVPLQVLLGDQQGLNTLKYQPTKLAAIEAHWDRESRAPLTLFAIPDARTESNRFAIEIPELGSLILTHDPRGVVPGLKDVPPEDRPPVAVPFFAFRLMVGIGLSMLAIIAAGWWLRARGVLYGCGWFLRTCEIASVFGFLAVIAGWTTTEVGRQPWTVYGLLRTADSVSPSLTGGDVGLSLLGYAAVYLIVYTIGFRHLLRLVRRGPGAATAASPGPSGRQGATIELLSRSTALDRATEG
ncbi:MAG TPA: cytochrome ubiquinol oxidase subunit I [Steroidobacteraceae bacterium]|nr:cytochrome ubiquinol oxidase subunit I [Steroidobacteraceae bacterium]HUA23705.1 cytochrome ubiquinol oxidase subunit I [Steroidobacteraceae bacterium]